MWRTYDDLACAADAGATRYGRPGGVFQPLSGLVALYARAFISRESQRFLENMGRVSHERHSTLQATGWDQ
jgi:hypothetical protein